MVWGDHSLRVRSARPVSTLAALLLVVLVATGCGSGGPETADGAETPCDEAVLRDWADGSIDGAYPPDCYLAAIDLLPEDVRTYTSAVDDITRASRSTKGGEPEPASGRADRRLSIAPVDRAEPAAGRSLRAPPFPVLLVAALGLLLLAGGLAASVARRIRRSG
jgi:hypothetical protein